jgi:hypothetical protein
MDSNTSRKDDDQKDKDQNTKPVAVTVKDGDMNFKDIAGKFNKNQDVQLSSGGSAVTTTITGALSIPAGRTLTIGEKVTLDLTKASPTVAGTITVENGATLKMKADVDLYDGSGKTVFKKGSTALLGSTKFLGAGKSGSAYEWDSTASGQVELGKNKLKLVSGTLVAADNIQAGYEVTVAKDATLKVADAKTLELLAAGTLNAAGKLDTTGTIKVAGTIIFEDTIKKHITLTNNGKVIALPNSTVKLQTAAPVVLAAAVPANPKVTTVIGTGGAFTWKTGVTTGGVELVNGFFLTNGTSLELAQEYTVALADTIDVANGATLTIKSGGTLKGAATGATIKITTAGGVTLDGGTANFYADTLIQGNSIPEGSYKWDTAIKQNTGWKKQAAQQL